MEFTAAEVWSIVASVVSVSLGALAIALAVYFFVKSRSAEAYLGEAARRAIRNPGTVTLVRDFK